MSDQLRVFTPAGNARFGEYLAALAGERSLPAPTNLLVSDEFSEPAPWSILLERQPGGATFSDRLAFGQYLVRTLSVVPRRFLVPNFMLWNWLSLYYFDQLCPSDSSGNRLLRETARYLMASPYRFDRAYRHLVWGPWMACALHPGLAEVILIPTSRGGAPLSTVGELYAQVAGRQGVFRSPAVMAALHRLYFDSASGRPRSGTGGAGRGSPRRFGKLLHQFERTFDLEWGDGQGVVELLPKEFDQWKR